MKIEDVKIGMKVVPHAKSIYDNLEDSNVWEAAKKMNQPFLFVIDIKGDSENI
jgi:hypothetical protein